MARPVRIQYADAVYHVMARGNQGREVFGDHQDRQRFLDTLGEACAKTGWQLHAYVLMPNHYHLLLQTPEPNLVEGMRWLQGTCTQRLDLPKGAPEKVVLAWWLRQRTSVPLRWVSERLEMGHYSRVTQAVSRMRRGPSARLEKLGRKLKRAFELKGSE
jgi:REP element-mobilizing transposase RayT